MSKNSGALRSEVVLKLGTYGVVGFILEGVSVDLGRTMLPVSPQISLSAASPLSTGTVECCRRARVSEFCFTPLSPERTLMSILLKGSGFGWTWCTRDARESRARRKMRRSVFALGSRTQTSVVDGDDLGCDDFSHPGIA